MRLKLLLPERILLEQEVEKITAEAQNGSFTLLPRHVDFVAALMPGLLSFLTPDGEEEFLAIDEGILIKCEQDVLVSTRRAVRGPGLGVLQKTIDEEFQVLDERERKTRTALAQLEADLARRFYEWSQGT